MRPIFRCIEYRFPSEYSTEHVWAVVCDLANLDIYFATLVESSEVVGRGAGAVRVCILKDKSVIVEDFIEFDENKQTMRYKCEVNPFGVRDLYMDITVTKDMTENAFVQISAMHTKIWDQNSTLSIDSYIRALGEAYAHVNPKSTVYSVRLPK